MAEFLTTEGVSYYIEKIIKEARNKLALVSPYLQLSMQNFNLLKEASNRSIKITLVFGKKKLNKNDHDFLKQIENVKIFFLKDLHSKCYMNEKNMVVTSMNLIEYSQKNNREMGILFDRFADELIFNQAIKEVQSILQESTEVDLFKSNNFKEEKDFKQGHTLIQTLDFEKDLYRNLGDGFCIRCGEGIEYNPDKPYCDFCFSTWTRSQNRNYYERICHSCGSFNDSTINKPECYDCYTG